MAYTLILLTLLIFGLIIIAIGGVLLFARKNKLAGAIVLTVGLLITSLPILGVIWLVIASRTMG